jgi:signal transduction histidine kinase
VHPVPAGLHVRADEAEFQQALINLLLNAIQACKPGGTVSLDVQPGNPLHLRVCDDGCGIPAETRKHIFEPFFSARQGGTGLGLFLSITRPPLATLPWRAFSAKAPASTCCFPLDGPKPPRLA